MWAARRAATVALSMRERQAITREMARRYVRTGKHERGLMLDELCALTGYNRSYAARLLRARARAELPRRKRRRGRRPAYGAELVAPLAKVWATLGGICGKRLVAAMARTVSALERHGELELSDEARAQLLAMSAATIDRLLAAKRRRLRLKGMSHTKPGSLLKSQIPVRTFAEWDQDRPGFVEIDLVGHEGGDARGDWAHPWRTGQGSSKRQDFEDARAYGSTIIGPREFRRLGADKVVERLPRGGRFYVTIDCDVLDPALAPGNGSPSPGGLDYYELTDTLRGIAARGDVVGFDFCEVAPMYDPSGVTCQVAALVVLDFVGAIFSERKKRAHPRV